MIRQVIVSVFVFCVAAGAQVYSPKLLREGQPDSTDLKKFAQAIFTNAGAHSEREKAEAIWRFFLTDGRFVKPGFWYHIAGWTYEEPTGEVLDPIKLLNSYGFGLCYHIAPLLAAVFDAGGFPDARCWFLTGHTVTEVFYEGSYHYYDSDMMGYNVAGGGSFAGKPVASVRALEQDSKIILGKLAAANKVEPGVVDNPWYPADVRASAMGELAGLFTSTSDNYLYPFKRYSTGQSMDFVLRRGEKLIRYFAPEEPGLFYLPYKFDGKTWTEFPQEFAEYQIRTEDGPRSQKDNRQWATGRIEYVPESPINPGTNIIDMPSPYVVIDARFKMRAQLRAKESSLRIETSTDGGLTWVTAGSLTGPHGGEWSVEPAVIVKSAHGRLTAVSGSYGYKVRISQSEAHVDNLKLVSQIQVNSRSLPAIQPGENHFAFTSAAPVERKAAGELMSRRDLERVSENGQVFYRPTAGKAGEAVYKISEAGRELSGFDVGARFFEISDGLVPNKLTAETRQTKTGSAAGDAELSWANSPEGPFTKIWKFPHELRWRDGDAISRLLRWPEVFQQVRDLGPGTKDVYVKFSSSGPAFDSIRIYAQSNGVRAGGRVNITQIWEERGARKEHVQELPADVRQFDFDVRAGSNVVNRAVIISEQ